MSWFDTERPHVVILCIIKHKLQKYYLSNSKSTNFTLESLHLNIAKSNACRK